MIKKIVEMPVVDLKKGLYVSRLDRPWIDSPFMFQGFEIETDEELTQLRSLCEVVFVEVSEAEAEELVRGRDPVKRSAPVAKSRSDSLAELSRDLSAHARGVPVKDPVSLKSELANAKTAYREARNTVTQVFDRLRRGGSLDVPAMETVVESMVDSIFRNREAMSWLACMKIKDDYLYNHSLAASVWALSFGRHLGLDKETLRSVGTGAMLLDIGKTRLPGDLLQKSGELTPQEWVVVRSHVDLGLTLVQDDPRVDQHIKAMIGTHHERMDGSGYPRKLKGDEIPLLGRIAGIVDSYDAMTSDRRHAKGKSTYDAVRELKKHGGAWFQMEMVELFIQAVGVFRTGTLVELNSGEVGVVTAQNRFRRLRPEIMLILDANKKLRAEFATVDLQNCDENNDTGKPTLWIARGLEPGAFGIDSTEYFL